MSTPTIDYDALAAQARASTSVDYDALAAQVRQSSPNLTENTAKRGTYDMWDDKGQKLPIPYDKVPLAQAQGYQFDTNPTKTGLTPAQQFTRDEAADPNRVGGTSMMMAPAGTQWAGQAEPQSRQESLQRLGQAETNASLPMRVLTGVMKGGATLGRPAIDVMNLGAGGNTPQEQSYMMEGRTPAETAAKVATIGAAMAPGLIAAPVTTAAGLAGGMGAGYVGGAVANAMGADPRTSAVVGDVTGLLGGIGGGALNTGIRPFAMLGPAGEAPIAGAEGPVNAIGGFNRLIPDAVRRGVIPSAWNFAKNSAGALLAGDVNAPIAGTSMTPLQRYASMKAMGLQPNAAEATNSGPAIMAQRVNQNSLTSEGTYVKAREQNLKALNDFTKQTLDSISTLGPEEGGAAVKQGLLDHQADLKAKAQTAYDQLDQQTQGQQIPGAKDVFRLAQDIVDKNAQYYKDHPEFTPTKAWEIVRNFAKKAPSGAPEVVPGMGTTSATRVGTSPSAWSASGSTTGMEAQPSLPGYSELHRLRSDLLEFNRANPDIVKGDANRWISNLSSAVDKAITEGEGSLSPEQVKTFRDANTRWQTIKDLYDNPQNPLYHAVRNPAPSTLVKSAGNAPENVDALKGALGEQGMAPIQRGVAEKLLGITKEGEFNFRRFQTEWNKLPEGVRNALFTPEQIRNFEDLGHAGTVLNTDVNPSGTAKLGQKQREMMEGTGAIGMAVTGHPLLLGGTAAYHGTQYGVGRLMNNPAFVDWLMQGRGLTPVAGPSAGSVAGRLLPAGVTSGALSSGWDFENNRPKQ